MSVTINMTLKHIPGPEVIKLFLTKMLKTKDFFLFLFLISKMVYLLCSVQLSMKKFYFLPLMKCVHFKHIYLKKGKLPTMNKYDSMICQRIANNNCVLCEAG